MLLLLLKAGKLKLVNDIGFLEVTPEEQVDLFRQSWPEHYDENIPEYDINNIWWYMSPADAVWIDENGKEMWR